MFCVNCGKEVDENAVICVGCGVALKNYGAIGKRTEIDNKKNLAAVILAMVFGSVSLVYLLICGLFIIILMAFAPIIALYLIILPEALSITGLILSVCANTKGSGKALSITGIVLNVVALSFTILCILIIFATI